MLEKEGSKHLFDKFGRAGPLGNTSKVLLFFGEDVEGRARLLLPWPVAQTAQSPPGKDSEERDARDQVAGVPGLRIFPTRRRAI